METMPTLVRPAVQPTAVVKLSPLLHTAVPLWPACRAAAPSDQGDEGQNHSTLLPWGESRWLVAERGWGYGPMKLGL